MHEESLEIKVRSKSFFWALFFFSKNEKKDIETLYSFCRYVDDISDNKNLVTKKNAKKIHLNIIKDLETKSSKNRIVKNFINLSLKYKLSIEIPIQLIQGVLKDLKIVNVKNLEQLIFYSYQVAGTVGLMMCSIMKVTNLKLLKNAIELGVAMQITNILRDIKEDLMRNRMYIPENYRSFIFLNSKELLENFEKKKELSKNILELIEYSDDLYNSALKGIQKLPFKYRLPILIASNLYQNIGFKIKNDPLKIWSERVFVKKRQKIFITIQAIYKCIFLKFEKKKDSNNHAIHKIIEKNLNKNG